MTLREKIAELRARKRELMLRLGEEIAELEKLELSLHPSPLLDADAALLRSVIVEHHDFAGTAMELKRAEVDRERGGSGGNRFR